uniref:Uncharacterized protein n=1 Tax=Arundo donax TaxID=35708 RepID=A0A0A9ACR4_ARUDO
MVPIKVILNSRAGS